MFYENDYHWNILYLLFIENPYMLQLLLVKKILICCINLKLKNPLMLFLLIIEKILIFTLFIITR